MGVVGCGMSLPVLLKCSFSHTASPHPLFKSFAHGREWEREEEREKGEGREILL